MRWPWARPEIRSNYTDLVVQARLDSASGTTSSVRAIAALEVASGLWSRSLAAASVEPASAALAGLTASVLADIGTQLCRAGESVYTVVVEGGRVVLHPVSSFFVQGDYDPRTWIYQVTQSGPTSTTTRRLTADEVLHIRLSCDPGEPWRGRSPMSRCPETAALASALETRLAQEAGGPVGSFLAVPEGANPKGDADVDPLGGLRTGIAGARGAPILHESVVPGYGDKGNAPFSDLRPVRFGANWPTAVSEARDPIGASILAACGVPPTLAAVSSDGTAQREAFRRFLVSTIRPVAQIIETELQAKLDPAAELRFSDLAASDVTGKARAASSLIKGGIEKERALRIAGL